MAEVLSSTCSHGPPIAAGRNNFHLFLGGQDLEMAAIRDLVKRALGPDRVSDLGLSWGAKASSYEDCIRHKLTEGSTPVLVELQIDLPSDIAQERLVIVDHHGPLAGARKPCALHQVFKLLDRPQEEWSRDYDLIAANDIGHIVGMREIGASAEEIIDIRNRDRAAQGISDEIERESHRAICQMRRRGRLALVHTKAQTSSAIGDFIQPEFGGPGAENLLVLMPDSMAFFGQGNVIACLTGIRGSWWGGALPARGFWGLRLGYGQRRTRLVRRIAQLVNSAECCCCPKPLE